MSHIGVLFHLDFVACIVGHGVDQKLVIDLAHVLQHEFDLLALFDLDAPRGKGHRARPVLHEDLDSAEGLFRITRLAGFQAMRGVPFGAVPGVGRSGRQPERGIDRKHQG